MQLMTSTRCTFREKRPSLDYDDFLFFFKPVRQVEIKGNTRLCAEGLVYNQRIQNNKREREREREISFEN